MAKDDQSVNMKPLAYIMTTTFYRSIYVYIIYIFIYTSLLTFTVKVASVNESKKYGNFSSNQRSSGCKQNVTNGGLDTCASV